MTESKVTDSTISVSSRTRKALVNERNRRRKRAQAALAMDAVRRIAIETRIMIGLPASGAWGPDNNAGFLEWLNEGNQEQHEAELRLEYEKGELSTMFAIRQAMVKSFEDVPWLKHGYSPATLKHVGIVAGAVDDRDIALHAGAEAILDAAGLDYTWLDWAQGLILSGDSRALTAQALEPSERMDPYGVGPLKVPYIVITEEMTEETMLRAFRQLRAEQSLPEPRVSPGEMMLEDSSTEWNEDTAREFVRRETAFLQAPLPTNKPGPKSRRSPEETRLIDALLATYKPGRRGYGTLTNTPEGREYLAYKGLESATKGEQRTALFNAIKSRNSSRA